ncbi:MAG: hypothetical protein MUO82_08555 [Candidatus Thermoplasmatota archaeon]|nr:hypothetical protein [Candidatus Thermoplasmatota archaeon]
MNHQKDSLDDTLEYISEITKVLDFENKFISIITDNVNKIIRKIIFVFVLLIAICLIPLFTYTSQVVYDRVIYASIGVLTFISIFYSLLISDTGRGVLNRINKSLETMKENVEKVSSEEIKKRDIHNDIMSIGWITVDASLSIKKLEEVKSFIDVERYLRITVFSLLISIVLSLFNVHELQLTAYALFVCGFSVSGVIILLWGGLHKILDIFEKHLKPKIEDKNISIQ